MAIKVSSLGQTVLVKKIGTNTTTFVKKVIVGTPVGRFATSSSVSLDGLIDVSAANPSDGDILSYDSTSGEWINTAFTVKLDAAGLGGTGLTYDSATDTLHIDSAEFASFYLNKISGNLIPSVDSTYDLGDSTHKWRSLYISGNTINLGGLKLQDAGDQFQVLTSTGDPAPVDLSGNTTDDLAEGNDNLYYTTARVQADITDLGVATNIRELFTASGDLSYDNATGEFSFDVEQVYTKANFDSDFNMSIDEAALNGTGLSYDSSTNTLSITDTGVVSGTYGSTTQVPVFTVNAQGQIDSVGEVLVAGVTSTTYDSATGIFTINTADGNSFATTFHDSDDRIAEIRSAVSASGDLSYDVNTGVFSFDVEQVYTKSNFDSDLNQALDEAALGGTGLTYDSSTNTLSITDTGVVAGTYGSTTQVPVFTVNAQGQIDSIGEVLVAGVTSTAYDSATGVFTINTADGGSFATTLHDSDDRIAEIRGALSASGDLTYNSSTGQFSFDVEQVYTKANFDSDLGDASTSDLPEGDNLYYTTARFDSDFGDNTTTDLAEGNNLYYTTARADSAIDARVTKAFVDALDVDADTFDTLNSTQFLRSDVADTKTSGDLNFASNVKASFGNSNSLDIYYASQHVYIEKSNGSGDLNITSDTNIDLTADNVNITGTLVGDSANIDGVTFNATPGTYAGGNTVGTLFWDSDEQKGLSFVTRTKEGFAGATINVGQESVIYVHNQTGETIFNGDAVYISGTAHGLHPSVTKARANAAVSGTLAIATHDIVDNAHGYVTRFGLVRDVNTGGLTAGADIYLSKDSDGKWTTTEVTVNDGYPLHIGKVVRVDSNTGTILVDPFTEHYEYLRIQDTLKVTGDITGSTLALDSSLSFGLTDYRVRPTYNEGTVWYDEDEHALAFHTADSDFIMYIGARETVRGRNSSGSTITRGTPVYTDGVHISGHPIHGHHPLIYAADAAVNGKYEVIGLAGHDIPNGAHGYVITRGYLDKIDTTSLISGERFHLAGGGGFQRNPATYPSYPVDLGIALTVDSANGGTGGGGSVYIEITDHTLENLRVTGDARVDGSMTIGGNLNVVGTTTQAITQSLTVTSNFVKLLDGDTLGTTYQNTGGLDDATFKGNYTGDSDLYYFVRISSIDSAGGTGDTIEWGISDSNQMLYGSFDGTYGYGAGFDSANGATTWSLKNDGLTAPLRNNLSIQFINLSGHDSADVWCAHPAELNLDLGLVGNYNPSGAGGLRYTGLWRDADDGRWRFFDGSRQDFGDSNNIGVQDSAGIGYSLADVQAGTFYGALSGNASTATEATQLATGRTFSLTGDVTASGVSFDGTGNVTLTTVYNPASIVNADISATAAIADTKLATISTAGKVQNGATTATAANTGSAIVARDASGNFEAGTITATTVLSDNFKHTKSTDNSDFKVSFTNTTTDLSGNYAHQIKGTAGFTYNPSTDTLTVGTLSGNASSADSAYHALSADLATLATTADSAYHALSADSATVAASALFATNATNATNATYADSATTAASALFATNATNATYADSATTAASALFATNATNADSATNATTALVANTVAMSSASGTLYVPLTSSSPGNNTLYASSGMSYSGGTLQVLGISPYIMNGQFIEIRDGSRTNNRIGWGGIAAGGNDAWLFYDGSNNTMELELGTDATSFIITDSGNTKFTFTKSTGDLSLDTITLADSTPSVTTNKLYNVGGTLYFNGSTIGAGGGGASVTTSASAPGSPSDGDLWFDETSTSLFLYYQDSDTSQWVQVGGGGGGGGGSSLSNIADSGTGVRISGDLTADSDGIFAGDVTAANFNTTSDARLKTNVRTIYDALDKTMQLRGVYFDKNGKPDIGLIAQEVEEVMPMAVNTLNDEMQTKTVNYGGLVGLLIQAIKNQQEQIDELNNKINRLME